MAMEGKTLRKKKFLDDCYILHRHKHTLMIQRQLRKTRRNSIDCHRRLCLHLLWPRYLTFWPQNLISTSTDPNTSVKHSDQNWVKFPSLALEIRCSHGCFWDAHTHSWTGKPEHRMSPAPNVFGGRGITAHCFNLLTSKWRYLNFYFILHYLCFNTRYCPHGPDHCTAHTKVHWHTALYKSDYYY